MRRALLLAVPLFGSVLAAANPVSCHAGETDENVRIMRDAAGSLKFADTRAYILEKQSGFAEGSRSEVAVIFGYADNRAACRDIADLLTERSVTLQKVYGFADKFECDAID